MPNVDRMSFAEDIASTTSKVLCGMVNLGIKLFRLISIAGEHLGNFINLGVDPSKPKDIY